MSAAAAAERKTQVMVYVEPAEVVRWDQAWRLTGSDSRSAWLRAIAQAECDRLVAAGVVSPTGVDPVWPATATSAVAA